MFLDEAFKKFFSNKKEEKTTENPISDNHELFDVTNFKSYNNHSLDRNDRVGRNRKNVQRYNRTVKLNHIIQSCRKISSYPEVDEVIDDVVNSIIQTEENNRYYIDFSQSDSFKLDETAKKELTQSFNKVISLLEFQDNGYDIIRQGYIDGRLVAEVIYDEGKENEGIKKLNLLSPLNLNEALQDGNRKIWFYIDDSLIYFDGRIPYRDIGYHYEEEQIVITPVGYRDPVTGLEVSPIYKALKATNNLTNIEDSMVLVRFMKGMMLRIWNVNVGRLPKSKAEAFLKQVNSSINLDVAYDTETGEIKNKKNFMKIFQDFIFPSRTNNDITQVDTVDGDNNLLEGPDHELFLKKLYKALNQPVSRLSDTPTIEYDSMDILKDEQTFMKYIERLRNWVKNFIFDIMKRDLIVRGVIKEEDWLQIKQHMFIKWTHSSNIMKRVEMELWKLRAETLDDLKEAGIAGKVVSFDYVLRNVLGLSSEQIEEQKDIIMKEKKDRKEWYEEDE